MADVFGVLARPDRYVWTAKWPKSYIHPLCRSRPVLAACSAVKAQNAVLEVFDDFGVFEQVASSCGASSGL